MIHKIIAFLKSEGFIKISLILLVFCYGAGLAEILLNHTWYVYYALPVLIIFYFLILKVLKHFDPYYRIVKSIDQQDSEPIKVELFFNQLLPLIQKELPQKLYRYVALTENEEENNKRFKTLENNEVWFSRADCLNDPFEGYNLCYSKDFAFDVGVGESQIDRRIELWEKYILETRKDFYICSFSTDYRIAPMWAHYTCNHHGFCIEYELVNPANFFQVQYWASKNDVSLVMERLQQEYFYNELSSEEFMKTLITLHKYWCSTKGRDWEYEREVRAIICDIDNQQNGLNKKNNDVGVKINGIYVGANCTEENVEKLKDIASDLKIFINQMEPDYFGNWSIMKEKST